MGKNQAYKQMQRAKHAASADGHFNEAEDGTIDASFHTPEWHAARVASLQVQRPPWEEWKKKVREEEEAKDKLDEDEERVMKEYRAQLDADRKKRLGKSSTSSQPTSSEAKSKKRKRSEKDREKEKKKSKKNKKDKKSKKRKKHSKRTRSPSSSSASSSESGSGEDGPIKLSEYLNEKQVDNPHCCKTKRKCGKDPALCDTVFEYTPFASLTSITYSANKTTQEYLAYLVLVFPNLCKQMSQALLPENFDEFRLSNYWDRFFNERGSKPFEWYGEWPHMRTLALPRCLSRNVLVIGCGNSEMSADMYDDGVKDITNIDFSKVVIREMLMKNVRSRPKMKWLVMDMTETKFKDNSFETIMDKGGLDALMGEENEGAEEAGGKLLREVVRLLDIDKGVYICVTLAQRQVLRRLLGAFLNGWRIALHQISGSADMALSPLHPVLAIIQRCKEDNLQQVQVEFGRKSYGTNAEQIEMIWKVADAENKARLNGKTSCMCDESVHDFNTLHPGRRVQLQLPKDAKHPKYNAVVLDSKESAKSVCMAFIVPQGRDGEWLYSSIEGQWQVASQCDAQRVIVASVAAGHSVASLAELKEQLSPLVSTLIPASVRFQTGAVPYVTVSDGVGKLVMREQLESEISGQVIVEDVEVEGNLFRRLVFGSSRSLIQSDVKLVDEKPNKSNTMPPVSRLSIQNSVLPCGYHQALVSGLALLPRLHSSCRSETRAIECPALKAVVIGLGGGGLGMFLHHHFQIVLDMIELDPAVVDIAKKWFNFYESKDVNMFVGDGVARIKSLADTEKAVYDVIILDAGGVDNSDGMSCPHPAFLDQAFLEASKEVLVPDGMLAVNFLARSKERYQGGLKSLAQVFPHIKEIDIDEDLNRVVFAFPNELNTDAGPDEEALKLYIHKEWDCDSFTIKEALNGLHRVMP